MILVYHDIAVKSNHENVVDIFHFFLQMLSLKISGKKVVPLKEYSIKGNNIVIAFDDGYYHQKKYALPVLKFFNFPFELFICEDIVNLANNGNKKRLTSENLKYMVKNGAHLQYHTKSHPHLWEIDDSEKLKEEIICPQWLKDMDKNGFEYLAYPSWQYNEKVLNIVKQYYKGARSGNGYGDNSQFAMNSIKITNNFTIIR